jgi:cytochrome c oxidase subunit II
MFQHMCFEPTKVAAAQWQLRPISTIATSLPTTIFDPKSTPAKDIYGLSSLIVAIAAVIFIVVTILLTYAVFRFRARRADETREPPQVYGSNQIELAWTVIPALIVLVLFLSSSRVIGKIQRADKPPEAIDVTVVGHQFWWEFRYPAFHVTTANELHVPVSDPSRPTPTYLTLLSADTDHSFWVPQLGGKTDLIPGHPNSMWIDPHETGLFLGQCAQYCGVQHAKMLLRVYVQSRAEFDEWIDQQQQLSVVSGAASRGRIVFEASPCLDCHAVRGIAGNGHFGPDLTHLMSRDTIASGAVANTPENLRKWIRDPSSLKPGSTIPALRLSEQQTQDVVAFLETLR